MTKYTEKQLEENYNKFIEALKKSFSGERLEKLLHMYSMEELGPNLMLSPASSNKYYHNSYEGGYIDHVMNVARNSLRMMKLYKEAGGIIDFEQEELLFAAFHHDLGKLGYKNSLHYVTNDSEWHIKNRGEYYKRNEDSQFLTVPDKTLFILNQYGLKYSENEYLGIKLADGMYEDDNQKYLKTHIQSKALRMNLPYVLHWADHMSTAIERDQSIKAPF